jgi:type II secretory pathway pseudopilin PulG
MKRSLKIIGILVILVIIGIAILFNLPKDSSKNKKATIAITASELFEAFIENESEANKKYVGKIIELSGIVISIEEDEQGATVAVLQSDDPIAGVMCTLERGQKKHLSPKSVGSTVRIKGLCTGKLMDVVLNKCILIE